ncbi:MAG: hypothetical protein A3H35_15630 [Betaproteobacteria bacterium RIFCSPLOWO2_02_FULL_62_17]|nr:MAG: hypothetical protein A3H35_15630 [Betaproteobacteria bacterium RIFCSPLOWO2_02_FULL_62_17]
MLTHFSKNFQPDQAFLRVAALIEAGDLKQASSAANTLPENSASRYLRGVCALSCGEPDRALVELEFATREPDFPAAHLALAGAFFAARQPDRAAAAFRGVRA